MILCVSLYQIPYEKYTEVLQVARNLLVSEIILFLSHKYFCKIPKPMKTILNFFHKVKSLDFYAPIFMFLTFIAIYYFFGFIELYQDKDLGIFYGTIYYIGILLGFTSVASFGYITYKYANNDNDDENLDVFQD